MTTAVNFQDKLQYYYAQILASPITMDGYKLHAKDLINKLPVCTSRKTRRKQFSHFFKTAQTNQPSKNDQEKSVLPEIKCVFFLPQLVRNFDFFRILILLIALFCCLAIMHR